MTVAKLLQLAGVWLLAWILSLALVRAGQRWPDPLQPESTLIWVLVLTPALLMLLVLVSGWRLRPELREGESKRDAQSP